MKKRIIFLTIAFLLIGGGILAFPGSVKSEDSAVQLLCLNIGKADCMLLTYKNAYYLIDAGYVQTFPALQTALAQYGIERLDGVFLTHCHDDHQGGLLPLAKSDIQVDAWYAANIYFDLDGSIHAAVEAASLRGQKVNWLKSGDTIPVGEDASFTVLGPISRNEENENNNSLVMRFSSPAGSILLTGDMKKEEIDEINDAGLFSSCDLLKVSHHGDNQSSHKKMLKAVKPQAAVIMTDSREETDTPAASLLKKLDSIDCDAYVTQNAHDAYLFTLKNGKVTVQDIEWKNVPKRVEEMKLTIDLSRDTLTIENQTGAAVRLQGCVLFSSKGNELFSVPDIELNAGQSYVIGTRKTKGQMDCFWDTSTVWNKSKPDNAILYDSYGRVIGCTNNGITE